MRKDEPTHPRSWAQHTTLLAVPTTNNDGDAADQPDELVGQREPEPDPNHPPDDRQ